MDRAEAEAIYDAGREVCVQFMLDLAARVERLEERLRRVEAQAREDSRTSSKPPSQDPPKTRQQRRAEARAKAKELLARDGAKRKAGGQEGHRGAGRRLSPEDQVDEIVDHYPHACRGCGHELGEDERRRGGQCGRHQVAELPPISVLVVEHRTHRLRCPQCKTKTVAELPPEVGGSAFGLRLQAAIVTLTARHRISRRGASELASDLFGAGLSTGAVDAICQRASDALAGPHTQLQDWILDQDAVHVDETGWRTAGESRALWTVTSTGAASFQIAEHCNREQLTALIGPYPGIVVSDRWPGYEHLDAERRQVCSSHLQRDFRRHSEGLAEQKGFGEHGLELAGRVFGAWRAYRHDHHDRTQLQADIEPIRAPLRQLLEDAGQERAHPPPPTVRQQPAQGLARAVDLRHGRRGRAHQQPGRARASRPGHPPQTLPRHPQQRRRTIRRTRPVRRGDLPPAQPLTVRLPTRTDHRPHPRRPIPGAHLSQGLNGYGSCDLTSRR
jgi:transposase